MLKSVTWGEYIHFLVILIPVYYAIVLALYFRSDTVQLLSKVFGRRHRAIGSNDPGSSS